MSPVNKSWQTVGDNSVSVKSNLQNKQYLVCAAMSNNKSVAGAIFQPCWTSVNKNIEYWPKSLKFSWLITLIHYLLFFCQCQNKTVRDPLAKKHNSPYSCYYNKRAMMDLYRSPELDFFSCFFHGNQSCACISIFLAIFRKDLPRNIATNL